MGATMYSNFTYESLPLKSIQLDDRNPRIVTQTKLSSQKEILKYLFDHDELLAFIKKIVAEGKNRGAELPYVIRTSSGYTVIEGNTCIAANKVITGQMPAPAEYASALPSISDALKKSLATVDCSIAPNRDALLPIMASAHFGQGDKSKWGYLGSRKAVYDEWRSGRSASQLARVFDLTKSQINDLILEYRLYLSTLNLSWTNKEKNILLDPAVAFNPPVRFLQTRGHKAQVGIAYDKANLDINFIDAEAKKKLKHIVLKLVINPEPGLGATATYDEVFKDYSPSAKGAKSSTSQAKANTSGSNKSSGSSNSTQSQNSANTNSNSNAQSQLKPGALFSYPVTISGSLMTQLMKEAREINYKKFPAAATFLLRNIVEALLKDIIHQAKANPASQSLDLEKSLNLCRGNTANLSSEDKKILKEFQQSHLSYLNLGAHGNVVPNPDRVMAARDCIDLFVKRNV
jgi:hypothetical protein